MGEAGATWLVALDAVSGVALGLVAWRLWRIARGDPLGRLFAAGAALLALSYPTVSASHLDLGARPALWDEIRVAGQAGGALVVLCAYATARLWGRARPGVALGWSLLALSVAAGSFFALAAPEGQATNRSLLVAGHAVMVVAWAGAAALAGARTTHAAVPLAFVAFAAGKVAWLATDLGWGGDLVPVIYAARFAGIGLLLTAIPRPHSRGGAHAAA